MVDRRQPPRPLKCKHCGVLPFGEGTDAKGVATAAINIRCLDDFEFEKVPVHQYDGRKA